MKTQFKINSSVNEINIFLFHCMSISQNEDCDRQETEDWKCPGGVSNTVGKVKYSGICMLVVGVFGFLLLLFLYYTM